ncbi:histone-lysine N-methyltransferase SETD7 isoform X2 [Centrocercus urophasianus]|uniref:histone-lysine N-methyltransferase SETD7 isoform X2 n=1 Tax=Centrocercus urophasianus TaxID=9002 RepID=UPI001C64D59A|nr:histone-lysine N-methyltransferase SETD7 isoform X2 [Centrocercus urophasianus]
MAWESDPPFIAAFGRLNGCKHPAASGASRRAVGRGGRRLPRVLSENLDLRLLFWIGAVSARRCVEVQGRGQGRCMWLYAAVSRGQLLPQQPAFLLSNLLWIAHLLLPAGELCLKGSKETLLLRVWPGSCSVGAEAGRRAHSCQLKLDDREDHGVLFVTRGWLKRFYYCRFFQHCVLSPRAGNFIFPEKRLTLEMRMAAVFLGRHGSRRAAEGSLALCHTLEELAFGTGSREAEKWKSSLVRFLPAWLSEPPPLLRCPHRCLQLAGSRPLLEAWARRFRRARAVRHGAWPGIVPR